MTKLDIKTSTLKFANIWHYYFRGDIVRTKDFRKSLSKNGKWISTRADILLDFEKDERNVLYSGVISQYDLSHKSDKLERVYLTEAQRYNSKERCFKVIPGDILILDGNRIININLSYDYFARDKGRKSKFLDVLLDILLLAIILAPVVLVPYFFYGQFSLVRIVLGIIESSLILLFALVAVYMSISKEPDWLGKNAVEKWKPLALVFLLIFILLLLVKITLFPSFNPLQF